MASITITLSSICVGGNHLTFTVTGDAAGTIRMELDDVVQAIDEDERKAFVRSLVRLGKIGRNNAQLRTLFQNGVTVTV